VIASPHFVPKRFRIAHVLSSLGLGGQEQVALSLAAAQVRAGHVVSAISMSTPEMDALAPEFRRAGVALCSIPRRAGRGIDLGLPLRLARFFARERIELVHTHNPQPLIYGAPAARLAGARVVHTKHGTNPVSRRQRALLRLAGSLVSSFVAVSPALLELARDRKEAPAQRLHVIANGIELVRYQRDPALGQAVRGELGIPETAWVVGTVGRLSPEKDQALLVRAMAPLLNDERRLIIVGDGAEAAALHALAVALGASRFIHFLGRRHDVPRLLTAVDAFALPSRSEGLPLALLEAMAAELPVVSTAVGGVPALLSLGEAGLLVPAGDADALRSRLCELAESRPLSVALGKRARAVVEADYSVEKMAERYLFLYARALDEKKRALPRRHGRDRSDLDDAHGHSGDPLRNRVQEGGADFGSK
jgi:glycosyltransferase involved in cell wall biosynthesis